MSSLLDKRAIKLIDQAIHSLEINLEGLNVLTEVGSATYKYIPVIAAKANATNVFAWTRNSRYGSAEENIRSCQSILEHIGLSEKVEFFDGELNVAHLNQADVITNSGFLRPLDRSKLQYCKAGVVIPLMFEAWELRDEDVNLDYCKSKGIRVAGTWEKHPSIKVFQHIGQLALKMAFEAGYEVFDNKILIWSEDEFGEEIEAAFKGVHANQVVRSTDPELLYELAEELDFIFIAEYKERRSFFDEILDLKKLRSINATMGLVHLYGDIDMNYWTKNMEGFIHPQQNGLPRVMTRTLGHVGLLPIINLQAAGLKVGEMMIKNETSELMQPINF
ncbi:hypothetical protein [Ekhidna sp.]|jgi:hypothetical protein|uniref:hypothetical protein n=1 Tax=Ekhidna sp. TaxID=2608089 RepID=UPI0032ED18ED